jgi:hypothetical protein
METEAARLSQIAASIYRTGNSIHSNSRENLTPHVTCPYTRAPAWGRKSRNCPLSGILRNIKIGKIY